MSYHKKWKLFIAVNVIYSLWSNLVAGSQAILQSDLSFAIAQEGEERGEGEGGQEGSHHRESERQIG